MRLSLVTRIAFLTYVYTCTSVSAQLVLNELVANPSSSPGSFGLADAGLNIEEPDFSDWVEIYNPTGSPVNLQGYTLSDDPVAPSKWAFPPSTSIPAGGYLVVLTDGIDEAADYLHTNFSLSGNGEYLVLSDANGNVLDSLNFPQQVSTHAYGRIAGTQGFVYLSEATPGAANSGSILSGVTSPPVTNIPPGFYDAAVSVTLATTTPDAIIHYTLDGSVPTSSSPVYNNAIVSAPTGVLGIRAIALKSGWIGSQPISASYLINQADALKSLPAVHLQGDAGETFYAPNGILASTETGRASERPVSLEVIHPDGTAGAHVEAGIRTVAISDIPDIDPSMDWRDVDESRPQLNIYFRNEYGTGTWDHPIGSTLQHHATWDKMRIRTGHNDWRNPFLIDEYVRRLFVDMGHVSTTGVFANLYLNGQWKAYVNIVERHRETYFQEAYGSDERWDVIHIGDTEEGDDIFFEIIKDYLETEDLTNPVIYSGLKDLIDLTNYVDYIILNTFVGNTDWPHNNYDISHERSPDGKSRFHVWDAEKAFNNCYSCNPVDEDSLPLLSRSHWGSSNPVRDVWLALKDLPEFKLLFADRIQYHFRHGRSLTVDRMTEVFELLKAQIEPMINYAYNVPIDEDGLISTWLAQRHAFYFGHLTDAGLWPATEAPETSPTSGTFQNSVSVSLSNPNISGTIYYTLDGSDPRAFGGSVNPSATPYTGPFAVASSSQISARILNGAEWSPIERAQLTVAPALRVTELMYRPAAPSPAEITAGFDDNDLFEFIELLNAGSEPINLSEVTITNGVQFDFPIDAGTLAPSERVVLVSSHAAFAFRYGIAIPVAGVYSGRLQNSGETVALSLTDNSLLQAFTYNDSWHPSTDGTGFSLQIVDPLADTAMWNQQAGWQASQTLGGTPGSEGAPSSVPAPGSLVTNEVSANTSDTGGDWIELYNRSNTTIDIGEWFLSDDPQSPLKFEIPTNTLVPPGGYHLFRSLDHFGPTSGHPGAIIPFGLSSTGDEVVLTSASNGIPTGYSVTEDFRATAPESSSGLVTLSTGADVFTRLLGPTPGAANLGPYPGEIVIQRLHYHPASGQEFIELVNRSTVRQPLFDINHPANTWQLDAGVEYVFPAGTFLDPAERLVVVPFDPVLEPGELSAFLTQRELPPGVPVFGPYTGSLDNGGEKVRLSRPGVPLPPSPVPFITVDAIRYDDLAPWPTLADGEGASLTRRELSITGHEPTNWEATTEDPVGTSAMGQWLLQHYLAADLASPAAQAWLSDLADRDQDGFPLLLEFYLAADPESPASPNNFVVDAGTDDASLTFRRFKDTDDLVLILWSSDDGMATWNTTPYTITVLSEDEDTQTLALQFSLSATGKIRTFLRLEVSRP